MPAHDRIGPGPLPPATSEAFLLPGGGIACSFSKGTYRVDTKGDRGHTNGQGLLFDDSDRFGPSKCHPRTGDLTNVPLGLRWFWAWYPEWRKAGRPTVGTPMTSDIGPIHKALYPLPEDPTP